MRRKGFGYTHSNGQPVPRYYDRLCGGWIRLNGNALIQNGRRP